MLIMALMLMIADAGFIWYAMIDTMKTGNFVPSVLVFFGFEVSSLSSASTFIRVLLFCPQIVCFLESVPYFLSHEHRGNLLHHCCYCHQYVILTIEVVSCLCHYILHLIEIRNAEWTGKV